MDKIKNCPHCGLLLSTIDNNMNKGNHVRWCIENPNKKSKLGIIQKIDWDKVQKDLESGLYTRKEAAEKYEIISGMIGASSRKNLLNSNTWNLKKYYPSEEDKQKVSLGIKKAHAEGRHPGWAFINQDISRRSYPEKVIFDFINKNGLNDKYQIIEKLSVGRYFLDFAFIDLKLDLEVDGETHYRDQNAIEHDKKRNDWLIENGWKVYRIKWVDFNQNKVQAFKDFLEYLDNVHNNSSVFYELRDVESKIKPKHQNQSEYFIDVRKKAAEYMQPKIEKLIQSDIDFSKFGWVGQAAKFLGIKQQKVNKYMKQYANTFYIEKCFKRK